MKKDWSRDPLPIGTIRIHSGVRRIKVSMREPKSRQWMDYARWWWLKNRGEVPAGKRVAHADGNTLNDDPSNLLLVTPDEIAFLWHERDPRGSRRNYEKLRAATAEFNRESARVRREREWLPSMWYAVDLARRVVFNAPRRNRWQVYQLRGLSGPAPVNGRGLEAAVLGWPELPSLGGFVLAALVDRGWIGTAALLERVQAARSDFGLSPVTRGAVFSANCILSAGGYLLTQRVGPASAIYHVGRRAIECRVRPLGVVAVRGSELASNDKYAGFARGSDEPDAPVHAAAGSAHAEAGGAARFAGVDHAEAGEAGPGVAAADPAQAPAHDPAPAGDLPGVQAERRSVRV